MELLANGSVAMTRREFEALPNYSGSLPTGTTPGKSWRRAVRYGYQRPTDQWRRGTYGKPYPEGHPHAGQIPIIWQDIVIKDQGRVFPRNVNVPVPVKRGRMFAAPVGTDEGELCMRDNCLGVIEYMPDSSMDGCGCRNMPMPPCSYCTSTMPECPRCGWREED
jgi:hypothetical protein